MGYTIQRTDGTRDGLGDSVVFATEEAAWDAARTAFGRDPASEEGGVESWLEVVEAGDDRQVATRPGVDSDGDCLRCGHPADGSSGHGSCRARCHSVGAVSITMNDEVTDSDIEALRAEAAEAGDDHQVAICDAALATVNRSVDAYKQCERVIRDDRAQR